MLFMAGDASLMGNKGNRATADARCAAEAVTQGYTWCGAAVSLLCYGSDGVDDGVLGIPDRYGFASTLDIYTPTGEIAFPDWVSPLVPSGLGDLSAHGLPGALDKYANGCMRHGDQWSATNCLDWNSTDAGETFMASPVSSDFEYFFGGNVLFTACDQQIPSVCVCTPKPTGAGDTFAPTPSPATRFDDLKTGITVHVYAPFKSYETHTRASTDALCLKHALAIGYDWCSWNHMAICFGGGDDVASMKVAESIPGSMVIRGRDNTANICDTWDDCFVATVVNTKNSIIDAVTGYFVDFEVVGNDHAVRLHGCTETGTTNTGQNCDDFTGTGTAQVSWAPAFIAGLQPLLQQDVIRACPQGSGYWDDESHQLCLCGPE